MCLGKAQRDHVSMQYSKDELLSIKKISQKNKYVDLVKLRVSELKIKKVTKRGTKAGLRKRSKKIRTLISKRKNINRKKKYQLRKSKSDSNYG